MALRGQVVDVLISDTMPHLRPCSTEVLGLQLKPLKSRAEETCRVVYPVVRTGFQEEIVCTTCPRPLGKSVFGGTVIPLLTRAASASWCLCHADAGNAWHSVSFGGGGGEPLTVGRGRARAHCVGRWNETLLNSPVSGPQKMLFLFLVCSCHWF